MCAAVPVALFLLALFAGVTLSRLKSGDSPNASMIAAQFESLGKDSNSCARHFKKVSQQAGIPKTAPSS